MIICEREGVLGEHVRGCECTRIDTNTHVRRGERGGRNR